MEPLTTFSSDKESLMTLLNTVGEGKTQLPDFQRGWVWDDEHIRSLLASVSRSYPIGAVMMLQMGNPEVRFKPRPVEGVAGVTREPERLILDGQQRLTSLYQALISDTPVGTKNARGRSIRVWYYLDISKALDTNADREEAIVSIPEDRKVRSFRNEVQADYSTMEKECRAGFLPLRTVFDMPALTNWQREYIKGTPEEVGEHLETWNKLLQEVVLRFQQYLLPVIQLRKENPKEAVCQVFERVNSGGVSLTVFELLTATYAADNFSLRDDWTERSKKLRDRPVLRSVTSDDFLQTIALLTTYRKRRDAIGAGTPENKAPGVACKRRDILRSTVQEYERWSGPVLKGFERSARLMLGQKIFAARDLPYRTQLTPLSAILALLGDKADNDAVRAKLIRWFWCGVFGELYGGAIETRFARDLQEVLAWVDGGPEPATMDDANFVPTRLLSLRTRNSAAYKGVYALLMRDGCLDFRTGESTEIQTYFDDKMDIHHIFPQKWCRANSIEPKRCDSIVNKTAISAKTNRSIGGRAPSKYLGRLQRGASIDQNRMDEILRTHAIDPELLRADDFEAFFDAREKALLSRIEAAMGKPILVGVSEEEEPAPETYETESEEGAA